MEDHEIRHNWPRYNRAQKKPKKRFGVYHYQNQVGARCLAVNKVTLQQGFIRDFYSHHDAVGWVARAVEAHNLNSVFLWFSRDAG
ncbi:MAG: hypothetical protein U5L96_07605 [Owenweeksia sp.]|nr:hypothetical protein [Owenweeksia sp.]